MTDEFDQNVQTLRKIADQIAARLSAGDPSGVVLRPAAKDQSILEPATSRRPQGFAFAKLAHELKTPLSAIVAASELMRDERFGPVGDERYRTYAAGIYDSAHHALSVINAMLGDATTNAGDAAAFAELDLNRLVGQVGVSVRALLEAAGLTIEAKLQPGLPHVVADPVTVRQMLLNLVTNAMRATPAGGHIVLTTTYDLAGPVHVCVSDTGCGMTEGEISQVLERDQDSDEGGEVVPRFPNNWGLGFPLIVRLARLNGASIAITSTLGCGTNVAITFAAGRVIPV
jgi:two-component system, cell cycle sensor histidine kinase PleC